MSLLRKDEKGEGSHSFPYGQCFTIYKMFLFLCLFWIFTIILLSRKEGYCPCHSKRKAMPGEAKQPVCGHSLGKAPGSYPSTADSGPHARPSHRGAHQPLLCTSRQRRGQARSPRRLEYEHSVGRTGWPHAAKWNGAPNSRHSRKFSKWIKDLNLRPEVIKPLDTGPGDDFFGPNTKSTSNESKI